MTNEIKNKGYTTADELEAEIKALIPDYQPGNLRYIRPRVKVGDEMPLNVIDLRAAEVKPTEYVLYPCLPVQGIGFLYAATGVGKTLFALNLGYAIARGGNYLKYSCPKPRKVLYVDGEMAFSDIHRRIMQIMGQQGLLEKEDNFYLFTPDKMRIGHMPQIDDELGQTFYEEIIERLGFEVIIFDNLSVLSSIDENKANEWKVVEKWLLSLRVKGKTVLIIHHAGKDKNGYRGTSKMCDCIDVAISLQPINNNETQEEGIKAKKIKVVYTKSRHFGGDDALSYEVIFEDGEWRYQSLAKTTLEKVIEGVKAGMSQRDIAKELNLSQSTVFRLIQKAKRGLIQGG